MLVCLSPSSWSGSPAPQPTAKPAKYLQTKQNFLRFVTQPNSYICTSIAVHIYKKQLFRLARTLIIPNWESTLEPLHLINSKPPILDQNSNRSLIRTKYFSGMIHKFRKLCFDVVRGFLHCRHKLVDPLKYNNCLLGNNLHT